MKKMIPLGFVLIGLVLVTATSLRLTVNGKSSNPPAIVVNGKTYLPLEARLTTLEHK